MVQWTSFQLEDASWEDFAQLCKLYHFYHLKDKVILDVGGNDTLPLSLEEPIEEDLKKIKVAQDSDKEAQEIMGNWLLKPKLNRWWIYLNDYVVDLQKVSMA